MTLKLTTVHSLAAKKECDEDDVFDSDRSNDSVDAPTRFPSNARTYQRWKESEVPPFLHSYRENSPKRKGRMLWKSIQNDLRRQGIYKHASTLEKKWNNLLHRFNKDGPSPSFPYHATIRDILLRRNHLTLGYEPEHHERRRNSFTVLGYQKRSPPCEKLLSFRDIDVLVQQHKEESREKALLFKVFRSKLYEALYS
jgi:hypothetical protein